LPHEFRFKGDGLAGRNTIAEVKHNFGGLATQFY
jgi:hypothetical protein